MFRVGYVQTDYVQTCYVQANYVYIDYIWTNYVQTNYILASKWPYENLPTKVYFTKLVLANQQS